MPHGVASTPQRLKRTMGRRVGVEGTISQGVRRYGLRWDRWKGEAKTPPAYLMATALDFVPWDALGQDSTAAFIKCLQPLNTPP